MPTLMDWLTIAAIIVFGTIFILTVIKSVEYEHKAKVRKNREALIAAMATSMYTPNELRSLFNDPPHTRVITEIDEPTLRLVTNDSAYSQYLKRQEMMLRQWDRKAADALIMDTAEEARRDFE